jgi:alginate O-acetyltransferase complex protein AlgI
MKFPTFTYFIFFWLVFLIYWGLGRRRRQNALIVAASYFFYGWWDMRFASLLLASTLVDFFLSRGLEASRDAGKRRLLLACSLVFNLGLLGVFKYFGFFTDSLIQILETLGVQSNFSTLNIVLPVGISFYTFQTISFTYDVYRGQLKACDSIIDYAAYVSFFPQLVAGPIERGKNLLPQFLKERVFDLQQAKDGIRQVLWGLIKKLVIADNLGIIVDAAYAAPGEQSGVALVVATLAFGFQIYGDFSAYSDIATGSAKLLGFSLMRNFAFPYFSQNLAEFWRRWHISLSTWFRDYLFIPLGGSRKGPSRTTFNLMATFIISGLWHGASINFLVWGALNGLGICYLSRAAKTRPQDPPFTDRGLPTVKQCLDASMTFTFIMFTWIFFRAGDLPDALTICARIASIPFSFNLESISGIGLFGLIKFVGPLVLIEYLTRRDAHPFQRLDRWPKWTRWLLYAACLYGIVWQMPYIPAEFMYFQF